MTLKEWCIEHEEEIALELGRKPTMRELELAYANERARDEDES